MAYVSGYTSYPTNQNLSLCPRYYSDRSVHIETLLKERDIGFSMPFLDEQASIYAVTHEYGHMLQNMLYERKMKEKGWIASNNMKFVDYTKKTKKAMFKWYRDIINSVQKDCATNILKIAKEIDDNFNIRDNISP